MKRLFHSPSESGPWPLACCVFTLAAPLGSDQTHVDCSGPGWRQHSSGEREPVASPHAASPCVALVQEPV